jgi:deoxyribonuclease V
VLTLPENLWPRDVRSARILQKALAGKVKLTPLKNPPALIAGVDACFTERSVIAVASLFTYPELTHLEDAVAKERVRYPYIPGLLSFREGPAIIKAVRRLKARPDLLIFDGQGVAHPLGIGIASHIGVILNIPAIGCAKSRLVGIYDEPGFRKGDWSLLFYESKCVGAVLRTRDHVRPVFVSPGHCIDLKASIDIVLHAVSSYRLPEPIRRADRISRIIAKEEAEHER